MAEQWTGTRVEVSAVLRAMQDGLKGRVETAFGGTVPHEMPGVACGQGHECSPVRDTAAQQESRAQVGQKSETWKQKRANMRASVSMRVRVCARVSVCASRRARARSLMATH